MDYITEKKFRSINKLKNKLESNMKERVEAIKKKNGNNLPHI